MPIMTTSIRRPAARQNWVTLATRAFQSGDLKGARAAYIEALRHDRRNAQFISSKLQSGGAGRDRRGGPPPDAGIAFQTAARTSGAQAVAPAARSDQRCRRIEPFGLKAALGIHTVDAQPVVETA